MKKCEYCNLENNDQATHCEKCGIAFAPQQIVEEVQEEPPKQKKKKLLPIILGAVALALVAVLVVVFVLPIGVANKSDYMFPDTNLLITNNLSKTETVLVADAHKVGDSFDVYFPYPYSSDRVSLDGKVQLLYGNDKNIYVATEDGISQSIGSGGYFDLAVSGKAAVYLDEENKLYLQSIPVKEEPVLLCEQAATGFAISPDGNSVAYIKKEGEDSVLYVYHQGKHTKIGNDLRPWAISNDAQYIYCTVINVGGFYLTDLTGNLTQITETSRSWNILNKDHTQMLFLGDGDWYVLDHGEKIKVSGFMDATSVSIQTYMIIPKGASYKGPNEIDLVNSGVLTYGVDTLAGKYYATNGRASLSYVNENWEAQEAVFLTGYAYGISRDGSVLCYAEDNTLFKIENETIESKQKLAENVVSFVMTSNGSAVYYLDNENTVWYQKGTEKAVKLAESVHSFYITHDDYVLLLCNDAIKFGERSKLYAVKDGKKTELISEEVHHVYTTATATYYYAFQEEDTDYTYDLYGTDKGIDFEFITKHG